MKKIIIYKYLRNSVGKSILVTDCNVIVLRFMQYYCEKFFCGSWKQILVKKYGLLCIYSVRYLKQHTRSIKLKSFIEEDATQKTKKTKKKNCRNWIKHVSNFVSLSCYSIVKVINVYTFTHTYLHVHIREIAIYFAHESNFRSARWKVGKLHILFTDIAVSHLILV